MKVRTRTRHIFYSVLFVLTVSFVFPSCATTRQAKTDTMRKGLMMQDKSEYSRNKRHFKGSKSFKKQKKRNKRYKRKKIRR